MPVSGIKVTCSVKLSWISNKSSTCNCSKRLVPKKSHTPTYKIKRRTKTKKTLKLLTYRSGDHLRKNEFKTSIKTERKQKRKKKEIRTETKKDVKKATKKDKVIKKKAEKAKAPTQSENLENLLNYAGGMGPYQKRLSFVLLPFGVIFVLVYFSQLFLTATPSKYWCKVPELNDLSPDERRQLVAPRADDGKDWDMCNTYNVNWTELKSKEKLSAPPPSTQTIPCPDGWEFQRENFRYDTVATERGWVCDQWLNASFVDWIFCVGAIAGGLIFAQLGDRYGRIPVLLGATITSCVGGLGTIFTTQLWDYTICRFMVGMSIDNLFMSIYHLVLEYISNDHRSYFTNISIALFFGVAGLIIPFLSIYMEDWRLLLWLTCLPMILVIFIPCYMHESPRWLAAKGEGKKAAQVLKSVGEVNNKKVPEKVIANFVQTTEEIDTSDSPTVCTLFRNRCMRNVLLLLFLMYAAAVVIIDGMLRLTSATGMNLFIIFTLASLTEIPSALIMAPMLERWGRKYLTSIPMASTGVLLLVCTVIPRAKYTLEVLTLTTRFLINMSYNAQIQWATEILPTPIRASGASVLRFGGAIATLMPQLSLSFYGREWYLLPLFIFGVVALLSSLIALGLPETKGVLLPQTLDDSEKIIKEHSSLCKDKLPPEDVEKSVKSVKSEALKMIPLAISFHQVRAEEVSEMHPLSDIVPPSQNKAKMPDQKTTITQYGPTIALRDAKSQFRINV